MAEEGRLQGERSVSYGCIIGPHHYLGNDKELGMDENFAQVSLLIYSACGRGWLRYLYEMEAFTASGRWYLGAFKH